ncbi:MAG TPA: choice-of-anchor U domain-containing protein [Candidatus Saccharimonadales bacterium]|nr:choice-of-anchor U domain-containing protein [Candidatus Saccharimonadales bacterium]
MRLPIPKISGALHRVRYASRFSYLHPSNFAHISGRIALILLLVGVSVLPAITFVARPADALQSQLGAQQVTLNPGGGIVTNGSDGLRFTINSAAGGASYDSAVAGQDGVVYRATRQYCCGAGAPMLNIGGTLYGQAGPAAGSAGWSSLQVITTSGAASVGTRTSATGDAAATVRYTVVRSGLTYTMDRTVTYTYPNDYVADSYTFTIPDGNTDTVKFYLGGDTAPGSSDSGYGVMLTQPVRTVISLNTSSHIMFGFREVSGSKTFDGATSQSFSAPYATVQSGGNIGFVGTASNHDAGLMMQWNLGSTPSTQTASMQQFATQQGTNLNATFASTAAEAGASASLNFSVVNTELITVNGLTYTATLPAGLVIGSGSQSNSCGGSLSATVGGGTVALSGGTIAATSNCVISVPVVANTPGTYTISAASISGLASLTNNVGTSSLTVTSDNDSDGISNSVETAAPNSGDANNDGTLDKNQLNVTSFANPISDEYTTLAADTSCELTNVSALAESAATATDAGYAYPLGLLDFTADCGTPGYTATITQYYYDPPGNNFVLRKFVNGSYQTVSGATISTTTISGRQVLVVSYQVTDGGVLDDDGTANGVIVDPAGPAVAAASTSAPGVGAPDTGLPQVNMLVFASAFLVGIGLVLGWAAPLRHIVYDIFKKEA